MQLTRALAIVERWLPAPVTRFERAMVLAAAIGASSTAAYHLARPRLEQRTCGPVGPFARSAFQGGKP